MTPAARSTARRARGRRLRPPPPRPPARGGAFRHREQVHGASMTPVWHHVNTTLVQAQVRTEVDRFPGRESFDGAAPHRRGRIAGRDARLRRSRSTFTSGDGYAVWRDAWLANVALAAPGVACLVRAALGGPQRAAALLLGLGMLSFAAGNVAYVAMIRLDFVPPVPSLGRLGFLGFYPLACAGALVIMRRGRSLSGTMWLDGLLGAVGAATALAALLNPVLSAPLRRGRRTGRRRRLPGRRPAADRDARRQPGDPRAARPRHALLAGRRAALLHGRRRRLRAAAAPLDLCDRDPAGRAVVDRHDRDGVRALAAGPPAAPRAATRSPCWSVPLVSTATAVGVLLWATGGPVPALTVALAVVDARAGRGAHRRRVPPAPAARRRAPPGPHRRAHRARQPARPARARRARRRRAAARRPRRLQGDQRRARPRRRRRAAAGGRPPADACAPARRT